MYTYTYTYMYMYTYMCICVYVHMCICVYVYMCICVCVYVCMCVCIYIYIHTLSHTSAAVQLHAHTPTHRELYVSLSHTHIRHVQAPDTHHCMHEGVTHAHTHTHSHTQQLTQAQGRIHTRMRRATPSHFITRKRAHLQRVARLHACVAASFHTEIYELASSTQSQVSLQDANILEMGWRPTCEGVAGSLGRLLARAFEGHFEVDDVSNGSAI